MDKTTIEENKDYVYVVMLEWLTSDDQGIDYYIYKDYDKALKKFNALIIDECDADIIWVGSQVFDEDGEVNALRWIAIQI